MADEPEAEPDRPRQRGPELLQRCVAAEEVHRIGQRAAPGELQRIERAVGLEEPGDLDALVEPQAPWHAVGHVELGRHRHVGRGGVRTVRRTARAKRARFSTEPPNWSSRRLSFGLKKALRR